MKRLIVSAFLLLALDRGLLFHVRAAADPFKANYLKRRYKDGYYSAQEDQVGDTTEILSSAMKSVIRSGEGGSSRGNLLNSQYLRDSTAQGAPSRSEVRTETAQEKMFAAALLGDSLDVKDAPRSPIRATSPAPSTKSPTTSAPPPPKTEEQDIIDRCSQSVTQEALSGWADFYLTVVPALGHYGMCKEMPKLLDKYDPKQAPFPPNQWCDATPIGVCVGFNGTIIAETPYLFESCPGFLQNGFALGLCVNQHSTCPTSDLNQLLKNTSKSFFKLTPWGFGGKCTVNATILEFLYGCDPAQSYTYVQATCEGEKEAWYEDQGALGVFIALMVLLFFVVVSSVLVWANDWAKSHRKQKEERDEAATGKVSTEKDLFLQQDMVNVYAGGTTYGSNGGGGGLNYKEEDEEKKKDLLPKPLLTAMSWFDVRHSLADLVTVKDRNVADCDTRFFEGIRFAAMCFVIYGHTLFFPYVITGFTNTLTAGDYTQQYRGIGIFPAFLAVDTFFFLSGFLFMHLYLKRVHKDHAKKCQREGLSESEKRVMPLGPLSMVKMYVHRYLRLTPAVMAVLVVTTWLLPHLPSDGPLNPVFGRALTEKCKTNWWHQLLYIPNLADKKHEDWVGCMGWNWYLDCDMQMFIVAPIIAAAYVLFPPAFYVLVLGGVLGSAIPGGINQVFGTGGQLEYERPWYRAAPYVYGFFAATLVRNMTVRIHIKKWWLRSLCYLLGTGFLVSAINLVWCVHLEKYKHDTTFLKFCQAWAFVAWGLGLTFFTVPWACGHGGLLPRFLGHPVFAVLSKLTFGMYLIHPVVISIVLASQASIPTFNTVWYYYHFGGFVVWAGFAAVCIWVLVEFPFAKMNDMLTK